MVEFDYFFDNLAEFLKNLLLVVSVASAEHQSRRASDVTFVFFRPLHIFT